MRQSLSLEAVTRWASQEMSRLLWVFTRICHRDIARATGINYTTSCPVPVRSILILYFSLHLNFPSDIFLSGFLTLCLDSFTFTLMHATWPDNLINIDFITLLTHAEKKNYGALIMLFFFSISCYFLPAWYKCRPLRSGNTNEHRRTNIMLQHMYLLIKTKRNKSAEVWTYSCYFRTYMNIMLGFLHCLRCIWCKISETGSVYVVPYNGNNRTIEQEQPQYPIVERRRVQDTRYTTYTIISPQLSTTPHRKIREHIELIMTCKQKSPI